MQLVLHAFKTRQREHLRLSRKSFLSKATVALPALLVVNAMLGTLVVLTFREIQGNSVKQDVVLKNLQDKVKFQSLLAETEELIETAPFGTTDKLLSERISEIAKFVASREPKQDFKNLGEALKSFKDQTNSLRQVILTNLSIDSSKAAQPLRQVRFDIFKTCAKEYLKLSNELDESTLAELETNREQGAKNFYLFLSLLEVSVILSIFVFSKAIFKIKQDLTALTERVSKLRDQNFDPSDSALEAEIARLEEEILALAKVMNEAARRNRLMADYAQDVICTLSPDFQFIQVSPAASAVWQREPQSLLHKPISEIITRESCAFTEEQMSLARFRGEVCFLENSVLMPDQSQAAMAWSVGWSSEEELFFCVVHDITQKRREEQLLRENQARIRSLIEQMPVGLLVTNKQGSVRYGNPALTNFLKQSGRLSLKPSTSIAQIFEGLDCAKLEQLAEKQETLAAKLPAVSGELCAEISVREYEQGYLVISQDISERMRLQNLRQAFYAMISHDLRTPLQNIKASLLIMGRTLEGNPQAPGKNQLERAERNVDRLISMITDLLDLERIESSSMPTKLEAIEARQICEKARDKVENLVNQAGLSLKLACADCWLLCDKEAILRVLVNLLSNAIKFTPKGKEIWLMVESQAGESRFCVQDQGRGIPQDRLESLFDRFKQVEYSDASEKHGTGLGLAICRAIVHEHGGKIWAESREGLGSRFIFTLPNKATVS